jgi:hypothetical protein
MDSENYHTLLTHELYHALQKDIALQSCVIKRQNNSNSNFSWIVEGAAEYFAQVVSKEMNDSYLGKNKFMSDALTSYNEDKSNVLINAGAIASRGAAAFNLMIQRNFIDEEIIIDGTLFHDCISETDYLDSNSNIITAKNNWFKIFQDDDYRFTDEALGN